ncbi:MAG: sulfatase-like hydrolase/transferase, partial [Gammaproteobacteria bacterium]
MKTIFKNFFYVAISILLVFIGFLENNISKIFLLSNLILSLSLLLILGFIVYCIIDLIFRKSETFSAVFTSFAIILLFTYSYICDHHFYLIKSKMKDLSIPFSLMWVLWYTAALYVIFALSRNKNILNFFKIVIVFSCLSQLGSYIYNYFNVHKLEKSNTLEIRSFGFFKKKPNVYFLLIDGYPNNTVLKEQTNFVNPFGDNLREKGFFTVENSFSNYHFTLASVSSQLMGNYHQNVFAQPKYLPKCFSKIIAGNNNVVRTFKDNGYKFIFAPPGMYEELSAQGYENYSIVTNFSTFDILSSILSGTILRKYQHFFFVKKYLEPSDIMVFLKKYYHSRYKVPIFMYAHFMQAHDLAVTKNGKAIFSLCDLIFSDLISDQKSKDYLTASIKDMNKKILTLIDFILNIDPNAIIVINSDHGIGTVKYDLLLSEEDKKFLHPWERDLSTEQLKNIFKNFIAVYLPKNEINEEHYMKEFK